MPKTRINCPNCRQPIVADIEQLFDVHADPSAKQRLLSGAFNIAQCPHCGYQGQLATPIVYHDPDKELLLTFVPPEVGLARDDQERLIGSLINQSINRLPQEKRKGYLLRPQATLTLQGLIERVLEGEGITKEMIQAQQQRMNLIQRLANAAPDVQREIARQDDRLVDAEFFGLLRRLIEASLMGGDQESAQALSQLQENILPVTTFGREIQAQSQEVEQAMNDLRAAGKGLNREKLLEMVKNAPNETRLRALVSFARPIMDYEFFQILSKQMEKAKGEDQKKLAELREKLLELTRNVDQQVEARAVEARKAVNTILQAENIEEAMVENLGVVDEFFLQELNTAMDQARKKGDLDQIGKLQRMVEVLQQVSAPPELGLIEELLEAPDDKARRKLLEEHSEEITPDFMSALANITSQVQSGEDKELADRFQNLSRLVLRFSMEQNLKK